MTTEAEQVMADKNLSTYVIVTLVSAVVALFTALLLQVRKTSAVQDCRIADRDSFQADLAELAKSTGFIVQKNTEGLFVFAKELEALKAPKRKPTQGTGTGP